MQTDILQVPHDKLRQKSVSIVDFYSKQTKQNVESLIDTLVNAKEPEGVGLAFPQIGILSRGFVTYLDKKVRVYLNPELLDQDDKMTLGGRTPARPTLEGCLSIPWLYGPVWRPKKVKVKAFNENGVEFTKTLSSFRARLFLHELDHLEGVLFTDYTARDQLPLYLLDKQSESFTEIKDPSTVIKW